MVIQELPASPVFKKPKLSHVTQMGAPSNTIVTEGTWPSRQVSSGLGYPYLMSGTDGLVRD